jgi:hypothetical protein
MRKTFAARSTAADPEAATFPSGSGAEYASAAATTATGTGVGATGAAGFVSGIGAGAGGATGSGAGFLISTIKGGSCSTTFGAGAGSGVCATTATGAGAGAVAGGRCDHHHPPPAATKATAAIAIPPPPPEFLFTGAGAPEPAETVGAVGIGRCATGAADGFNTGATGFAAGLAATGAGRTATGAATGFATGFPVGFAIGLGPGMFATGFCGFCLSFISFAETSAAISEMKREKFPQRTRVTPHSSLRIQRTMKLVLSALIAIAAAPLHAGVEESVKALASVGAEGKGNEAASAAWQEVVKAGPSALPTLLAAAGKGSPVADNWLRLAGDAIVGAKDAKVPAEPLLAFLKDTTHPAAARILAFDLLRQADAKKADEFEPSLVADPVQALRRGAVERLITAAKAKSGDDAKAAFTAALSAVRDEDQTKVISDALDKLGVKVDLPKHFGFLMKWNVIGPFDNADRKGFDTVFPPEKEIKLDAKYPGAGAEIGWQPVESNDDYGKLDFNKPLGMKKEVTAYATTTFESATERDAEIRLGCKNAWKVWLNGELLFGRDEYHRGQKMDQYILKCHLKKGGNTILVKACQNEQKEQWTVEWEFQLRVCDSTGTAILAANK